MSHQSHQTRAKSKTGASHLGSRPRYLLKRCVGGKYSLKFYKYMSAELKRRILTAESPLDDTMLPVRVLGE